MKPLTVELADQVSGPAWLGAGLGPAYAGGEHRTTVEIGFPDETVFALSFHNDGHMRWLAERTAGDGHITLYDLGTPTVCGMDRLAVHPIVVELVAAIVAAGASVLLYVEADWRTLEDAVAFPHAYVPGAGHRQRRWGITTYWRERAQARRRVEQCEALLRVVTGVVVAQDDLTELGGSARRSRRQKAAV